MPYYIDFYRFRKKPIGKNWFRKKLVIFFRYHQDSRIQGGKETG